jgi:hypothetical protein
VVQKVAARRGFLQKTNGAGVRSGRIVPLKGFDPV